MLNFSHFIDLPLIWGGLIATAVLLYVLLDGFDLGIGILFPFAPTDQCRDRMMNSIAPFWDGNETWLVLGGGGIFAAFPLAYSILMPALYVPIMIMLFGLIFRGVAFEFRFKASEKSKYLWNIAFHGGSLVATFMQGMILGGFVQGIAVTGRAFSGGPFDWLTAFSVMTGVALVFGYALLGSTWLIMKTEGQTQEWARKAAFYSVMVVAVSMAIVSLSVPFLNNGLKEMWFSFPHFWRMLPIPLVTMILFVWLLKDLKKGYENRPFFLSATLFFMGYLGLGVSLWPWIVPFKVSLWQAAAAPESQSLLLIGAVVMLPVVLAYTAYCYYVFRGKTGHEATY